MLSTIYKVSAVNALSENMDFQNKNNNINGGDPATCSDYSADRLTKEISGILPFN